MTKPYAYTIDDAVEATGIGRTRLYHLIGSEQIKAVKQGRKTLVLADSVERYIDSLPRATITTGQTAAPSAPAATFKTGQPAVVAQLKAPPVITPRKRARANIEATTTP